MFHCIDDYSVEAVSAALRRISMSDTTKMLVYAHATYGIFARDLALALDPSLERSGRPTNGHQSDWTLFINRAPHRWTSPSQGEKDDWVLVMRETLARALERVGFAPCADGDLAPNAKADDDIGVVPPNPLREIEAAAELADLDATAREAVIQARVEQDAFGHAVIERWAGRCAVTGVAVLPALVASHIKPWMDSSNEERLDACNGLLLIGTLDRLFDHGLITVDALGRIEISPVIPKQAFAALGLSRSLRLRVGQHLRSRPDANPAMQHGRPTVLGEPAMPRMVLPTGRRTPRPEDAVSSYAPASCT